MTQVLITESYLDDIADAIRGKNGSEDLYTPAQMATAIENLPSGEEPDLVTKAIVANGTYAAEDEGHDGYSQVAVQVPNSYAAGDEGKVVSSGALVSQTSTTKSANGTYDTTLNNEVVVDVPNTYTASDEGKVVDSGALVTQGSLEITQNGTFDTTLISEVVANVEDEELRQMVYNVYPTEQAHGNPATFDDGADGIPVKDLKVSIVPTQDLHGYDKPWAVGAWKNKLPMTNRTDIMTFITENATGSVRMTGTAQNSGWANGIYISLFNLPAGNYIVSCEQNPNHMNVLVNWAFWEISPNGTSITVGQGDVVRFAWMVEAGQTYDFSVSGLMLRLSTETDPTFAPYSNICPISGWTGANVHATGKNICIDTGYRQGVFGWNEERPEDITLTNHFISSPFIEVAGGETITITPNGWIVRYYELDKDKKTLFFTGSPIKNRSLTRTLSSECKFIIFSIGDDNNNYTPSDYGTSIYCQIEYGDTATPYEPYKGQTVSTDLGRTVYGGTLDVTTGVLTVDRASVDLGTLTWVKLDDSDYGTMYYTDSLIGSIAYADLDKIYGLSSAYKGYPNRYNQTIGSEWSMPDGGFRVRYTDGRIYVRDENATTLSAFTTRVNGVQLVYELKTPQTYTLTPQELLSVLGTNHISTDAESVDVEYRADIKLYIENLTKPEEDDLVANQAIEAGKFFMIGNRLFLSTASIANGATINPGTNCTELSLSDALNNLNS